MWPKAVKPSALDWNIWDLALATAFHTGPTTLYCTPLATIFNTSLVDGILTWQKVHYGIPVEKLGDNIVLYSCGHVP